MEPVIGIIWEVLLKWRNVTAFSAEVSQSTFSMGLLNPREVNNL